MTGERRRKIAILGGGVGALTTAFELTNYEGWEEDHEITVYQLGWRLGGKGASGRNRKIANRIEEHGLHVWFGFYENAFYVIRKAYEECCRKGLTPESPLQGSEPTTAWQRAFTEEDYTRSTAYVDGKWKMWPRKWPRNNKQPGDELIHQDERRSHRSDLFRQLLHGLVTEVNERLHPETETGRRHILRALTLRAPGWLRPVLWLLRLAVRFAANFTPLHLVFRLSKWVRAGKWLWYRWGLRILLRIFRRVLHFLLDNDLLNNNFELLKAAIIIDLGSTCAVGFLKDNVLATGFEALDQYDLKDWLTHHGCSRRAVDSAYVRGGYDSVFAYEEGDPDNMNFGAGCGLYGTLRSFLTYKGAFAWRMNAGMGDAIFSPLYLVLQKRGVKFEFFQRVTKLTLSEQDPQVIEKIEIEPQAVLIDPARGYQPLVNEEAAKGQFVRYKTGLPCWPNEPLYDQLKDANELRNRNLEFSCEPSGSLPPRILTRIFNLMFDIPTFQRPSASLFIGARAR